MPEEETKKEFGFLDGTTLKLIAMAAMLCDHVGDIFFPGALWMRIIGRIAMPIFAFCVAEGYSYTRDRLRYLRTLVIFALISEIPFDLAFEGRIGFGHQNIMFTFAISVAALMAYDRLCEVKGGAGRVLGTLAVFAFALLALLLRTDYTMFAVVAVFLFYVLRDRHFLIHRGTGVLFLAATRTMGAYAWTGLSFIPLLFYNGRRGKGLKWLFYIFYPAHLLTLWAIKCLIK